VCVRGVTVHRTHGTSLIQQEKNSKSLMISFSSFLVNRQQCELCLSVVVQYSLYCSEHNTLLQNSCCSEGLIKNKNKKAFDHK